MNKSPNKVLVFMLIIYSIFLIGFMAWNTHVNNEHQAQVNEKLDILLDLSNEQLNLSTLSQSIPDIVIEDLSGEDLINAYVDDICAQYQNNPSPEIVKSIIWHESTYNIDAVNGACVGLMQVSTKWHQARATKLGVTDITTPYNNILVGVDYLHDLLIYNNNDINLALMLYSMDNETAYNLNAEGKQTTYSIGVASRAQAIREGVVN